MIACDVCGPTVAATVIRPATKSREVAYYCDLHARQLLGWGDSFRPLTLEEQA